MHEITQAELLFFLGVCFGSYLRCLKLDGGKPQDFDFDAIEIIKKLIIDNYEK